MAQTKLIARSVASIGEEIGLELGTQMVKGYQQANPSDVHSYLIGRNIIDQILAQPGCVGIKFYNAYNENGDKTLVYVGVDQDGKAIIEFKVVSINGHLNLKLELLLTELRQGIGQGIGLPPNQELPLEMKMNGGNLINI